jgi:hypothetical protein
MSVTLQLVKLTGLFGALVAQGYEAPPELTPEEMELMRMMFHPVIIIIGLLVLVAGVWMVIDAWNNYGTGWGCLSCIGCFFFSWIAVIVYVIIRFAVAPPVRPERTAYAGPSGDSPKEYRPPPPTDIELTPDERDARLDEMIEHGSLREAMAYSEEMLRMARDFKDASGQKRYAKYIELIQRKAR